MSPTCRRVSSRRQQCRLKTADVTMSPTSWLDSKLGLVSADVSPQDCPAISMTYWAITPMDLIVIFKKKTYLMYFYNFLAPNYTITMWFSVKFCNFSLCPIESANMSDDILPTQHVLPFGMVRLTEFDNVSAQHSKHIGRVDGWQVIWGD